MYIICFNALTFPSALKTDNNMTYPLFLIFCLDIYVIYRISIKWVVLSSYYVMYQFERSTILF